MADSFRTRRTVLTEYLLEPTKRAVGVRLNLYGKTTTRLPESMVVLMQPQKVGEGTRSINRSDDGHHGGTRSTVSAAAAATATPLRRSTYGWAFDVLGGWVNPYDVLRCVCVCVWTATTATAVLCWTLIHPLV